MVSDAPLDQRWRCTCAYDGSGFSGWQSQPTRDAVQDAIERRLREICQRPIRIHGSGRTDAGVHARGQVFHFDAPWRHSSQKFKIALCAGLPPTIQIKSLATAKPDFHARYSARGKRYSYRIYEGVADPFKQAFVLSRERPRRLDQERMKAAAKVLCGRHDFRAFAADNGSELEDPVRDLTRLEIGGSGRNVTLIFEANGFLYKMVRSLTGALIAVGEGRLEVTAVESVLESGQRTGAVETAPAQGLFLERVFY
ncbi:MAG: tRNA pseudouridine(38-40) synthase TruA [Opitutaceae bacterium]|nr:tRNA pseudouridine(38-40) synthase TruA [Opitutaceae bacterium]